MGAFCVERTCVECETLDIFLCHSPLRTVAGKKEVQLSISTSPPKSDLLYCSSNVTLLFLSAVAHRSLTHDCPPTYFICP